MGGPGLWQGLAYARVGQTEIVVAMEDGQLLPQPVFALAQRADPSPDRGDMLPDGAVQALNERGVDLAAKWSQHGIDGLQGTKHHAMPHVDQPSPAHRLDPPAHTAVWATASSAAWALALVLAGGAAAPTGRNG